MTLTAQQRIAQSRLLGDERYRELLASVTGVIESALGGRRRHPPLATGPVRRPPHQLSVPSTRQAHQPPTIAGSSSHEEPPIVSPHLPLSIAMGRGSGGGAFTEEHKDGSPH